MKPQSVRFARVVATAVASLMLLPCAKAADGAAQGAASSASGTRDWSLRLPKEENVAFQGALNLDDAGVKAGNIMYPAPNLLIGLAAVLTHGAVVSSQQESQKKELKEKADKILAPYQGVLSGFTHRDLMRRGLAKTSLAGNKKLVEASDKPGDEWLIETASVFSLTQDHRAIILDSAILIYTPKGQAVAFKNTVRVVSQPQFVDDLTAFWTANEGEKLKAESAGLLAESLDIAANQVGVDPSKESGTSKTVRYNEGGASKFERGLVLSERCNRILLRTLRGDLLSVPPRRLGSLLPDDCGDTPGTPK